LVWKAILAPVRRNKFENWNDRAHSVFGVMLQADWPTRMSSLYLVLVIVLLVLLPVGLVLFSWVAERRNRPVGVFLEAQGVRLHYVERGKPTAMPVVLFHGNGSMVQDLLLSGLVEVLAEHHRVVCFDRPGFGYSTRPRRQLWIPEKQADLFASALTQLGISNPVVLGHSWGTLVAIAMGLAERYPVRGLVLVSGYYFPTWRPDFWILAAPAVPLFGDILRYTLAPIISLALAPSILRKLFAPCPVPPKFRNEFPVSLALRPKQLRAAAEESSYLVPAAARFQWRYRELKCPGRVISGEKDKILERDQAPRLHASLPSSRLRVMRDSGHMAHYVDPEGIAQAVQELLRPQ